MNTPEGAMRVRSVRGKVITAGQFVEERAGSSNAGNPCALPVAPLRAVPRTTDGAAPARSWQSAVGFGLYFVDVFFVGVVLFLLYAIWLSALREDDSLFFAHGKKGLPGRAEVVTFDGRD